MPLLASSSNSHRPENAFSTQSVADTLCAVARTFVWICTCANGHVPGKQGGPAQYPINMLPWCCYQAGLPAPGDHSKVHNADLEFLPIKLTRPLARSLLYRPNEQTPGQTVDFYLEPALCHAALCNTANTTIISFQWPGNRPPTRARWPVWWPWKI